MLVRRAAARLCLRLGWAPLHEVRLANGRRADILALQPGGGFVCIEVKSGLRDYLSDAKWTEYQPFCDQFFFAVDCDFPRDILPPETGLDRLRRTGGGGAARTAVPSACRRRGARRCWSASPGWRRDGWRRWRIRTVWRTWRWG